MSEFCLNNVLLLLTINKAKENTYWDAKGNIFNILKNSLQESLGLAPSNILTMFCTVSTIGSDYFPKLCELSNLPYRKCSLQVTRQIINYHLNQL